MGSLPQGMTPTSIQSFVQCADGSTRAISKVTDLTQSLNTMTQNETIISTSSGTRPLTVADLALTFAKNSDLDSAQDDSSVLIIPMRTYTRSENVWSRLAEFRLFYL